MHDLEEAVRVAKTCLLMMVDLTKEKDDRIERLEKESANIRKLNMLAQLADSYETSP